MTSPLDLPSINPGDLVREVGDPGGPVMFVINTISDGLVRVLSHEGDIKTYWHSDILVVSLIPQMAPRDV
jgi:hypothetical protein